MKALKYGCTAGSSRLRPRGVASPRPATTRLYTLPPPPPCHPPRHRRALTAGAGAVTPPDDLFSQACRTPHLLSHAKPQTDPPARCSTAAARAHPPRHVSHTVRPTSPRPPTARGPLAAGSTGDLSGTTGIGMRGGAGSTQQQYSREPKSGCMAGTEKIQRTWGGGEGAEKMSPAGEASLQKTCRLPLIGVVVATARTGSPPPPPPPPPPVWGQRERPQFVLPRPATGVATTKTAVTVDR